MQTAGEPPSQPTSDSVTIAVPDLSLSILGYVVPLLLDNGCSYAAKRQMMNQLNGLQQPQPPRSKHTFNQEFVPLLEKYFEYNAYPSAPDRAALARKSMMTRRQIEVWFQNHRNRAKKEGKSLQRSTAGFLSPIVSLESLEKEVPTLFVLEKEPGQSIPMERDPSCQKDQDSRKIPDHQDLLATFSLDTPSHAFPMAYPPSCEYDPFPIKTGKHIWPSIDWARRPAKPPTHCPLMNFDDFIADFATKLVLTEAPSRKRLRRDTPLDASPDKPWFAPTQTIPPCAPHPALVRSSAPIYIAPELWPPLSTIAAPLARLHPFRSPSPHSRPISLVPPAPATIHGSPIRRKIARLPKRTPNNTSTAYRGGSLATSDVTPPSRRSPSSTSRISSFSSDTSSDRHPSSSSSGSSSSSTLTTPVFSPASLLDDIHSSLMPLSEFDFQDVDNLSGDSPLVEGLLLNIHARIAAAGENKQPFSLSQEA